MVEAQKKINAIVENYKKFAPDEYLFVVRQIAESKKHLKNKYASTGMDYAERALTTVPENLLGLFVKTLSEDELTYYSSKEGTLWFAKSFPEFSAGKKI